MRTLRLPVRPARSGGPSTRGARRSGAALVEMAIVLPVFLTLMLGIIEFGRGMMVAQLVTNAAREGARLAVVGDSTNSLVSTEVKNFLLTSANVPANKVTVTITVTPYPGNPANTGNDIATANSRDLVTVNVKVPFSQVSLLPAKYLTGVNLQATSSMRYE